MREYKTFMIVMFFLSVFAFGRVHAIIKVYSLLGKCIYLDAGHPSEINPSINRTSCSK